MSEKDDISRDDFEDKKIGLERYKAKLDFWKFLAGSVFAAIAIATIPPSFQLATAYLETARKDRELSQSKATFHDTYIKDFVEKALNQDIEIRLRLAKYFSEVSDESYRAGWKNYLENLTDLRFHLRADINKQEAALYNLIQNSSKDTVEIKELRRTLAWEYGELGYSEPNRDVVKDPRSLSAAPSGISAFSGAIVLIDFLPENLTPESAACLLLNGVKYIAAYYRPPGSNLPTL